MNDDLRALWQSDTAEGREFSADQIRARIEKLSRTTRRRDIDLLLALAVVIIGHVALVFYFETLMPTAGALLTTIVLFAGVWHLRRRMREEKAFVRDTTALSSIEFLKAKLAREREFHRDNAAWWRPAILVPGGLLFFIGWMLEEPRLRPILLVELITFVIAVAAIIPANHIAARKRQQQIDELERLQKETS